MVSRSADHLPLRPQPDLGKMVPSAEELERGQALASELRGEIEGEIRFDPGDRAIYSTDASNHRQLPIGVVIPKTVEDVVATVAVARRQDLPILPRGGGTSLAGQCCNVAIVIDLSKYLRKIVEIDREARLARVQPGTVLDDLRDRGESVEPRLTFGPTPSTHDRCTIGGMIGNNACGNYSIMSEFYGAGPRMAHNVAELELLLYDGTRLRVGKTPDDQLDRSIQAGSRRGEIYRGLRDLRNRYADPIRDRFPAFPRRVSGYNLDGLLPEAGFDLAYALVGTEGTCATVLEATLHLVDSPYARSLVVIGFEDLIAALSQVPSVRDFQPIALEGFDRVLVSDNEALGIHPDELKLLPGGDGWLMAEFGGETQRDSDEKARKLLERLQTASGYVDGREYGDAESAAKIWDVRESGLSATAYVPGRPDTYAGWEDSAVPPDNLPGYVRDLRQLLERYEYAPTSLYGHFGQGCVHTSIPWDPHSARGIAKWRAFVEDASDLVLRYGGSFSGEHGDGQSRGELLEKMYGTKIVEAFRAFKSIWDPDWKMNPGKLIDPYPLASNLRLGPDFAPPQVETHFSYREDGGSFAHASLRCVGTGKCRRQRGGTMCPSYMVTREEEHSTRGRARILFEMMRGTNPDIELWRSAEVHDALDLCLSCKGCKSDCPVDVDMATYKAEFLSHYYRGRVRPRAAYALGLIYWWARIASRAPGPVNAALHAPVLASLLKRASGIDPRRKAPTFATETFVRWFRSRRPNTQGRPPVLLWPDTFTNFLRPEVGKAHVRVLESAGFRVLLPPRPLCCGRPLFDYGMLDTAEHLFRQTLRTLRRPIEEGIPLVGMEPSCVAAFRDELPNLFPDDMNARRLSESSSMLSEFLETHTRDWSLPRLERKALYHGHCHLRAIIGLGAEERMLQRLGLGYEILDSGCCGLAGSFGFERGEKYDVSIAAGERSLLPAVRDASSDTLLVTDGFSCVMQIEHNSERSPKHLAEVIALALDEATTGGPGRGGKRSRST